MGPNVFGSLQEFFDPDRHLPAPLVQLPAPLNPFPERERVRIFAKLAFLNPTLSLKWAPAHRMLQAASGRLRESERLVEATSGNMALALALQGRAFGVPGLTAYVPADLAFVKRQMLQLAGVELVSCAEAPGEPSAVEQARARGREPGMLNLGQYENPANPEGHARWTAGRLLEQTGGALRVFCSGLGTTGTLVGAREAFRCAPEVQVVGCLCAPGQEVPGVRTEKRLGEVRFDWREGIHHVEVGARESYRASLALIRAGLLAGPSSGFALRGLLRFLEACRAEAGRWEALRSPEGEIVTVFLCGDTPHQYVEKYSAVLDPEDFLRPGV